MFSRLALARAYLLGRRRAEAQAKRGRDDLADRFEAVNEEVRNELRALRSELARMHMLGAAAEAGRDETRSLH